MTVRASILAGMAVLFTLVAGLFGARWYTFQSDPLARLFAPQLATQALMYCLIGVGFAVGFGVLTWYERTHR